MIERELALWTCAFCIDKTPRIVDVKMCTTYIFISRRKQTALTVLRVGEESVEIPMAVAG